ncbi:adaptor-related protein complex 3, sigma 2 subunit, putative [Eimeria maxima]|uniref:AP complex subunit sigma n=1 Tax=Eimeria maxima TaxID=5804 RepID=U6MCZ4_EIMMA|nr:adaptor-related protein complex 3, sigma 2 subunit, putative [Eimeria maxima]CDJ61906.1 adaptor-related protein complex 3, sigma 2 subunit, putative [Eimeria maxima]
MIKSVVVVNTQGKPRIVRFYDGTTHVYKPYFLSDLPIHRSHKKNNNIHFATLFFIFVTDNLESELGILDLIQVFVQVLDACFENVCELDLVFHYDKINYILDEIIVGGKKLNN